MIEEGQKVYILNERKDMILEGIYTGEYYINAERETCCWIKLVKIITSKQKFTYYKDVSIKEVFLIKDSAINYCRMLLGKDQNKVEQEIYDLELKKDVIINKSLNLGKQKYDLLNS
jgi:hypothetical protein